MAMAGLAFLAGLPVIPEEIGPAASPGNVPAASAGSSSAALEGGVLHGLPVLRQDDVDAAAWTRGSHVPHISRAHCGGSDTVSFAVQEILGNMHQNLSARLDVDKVTEFLGARCRKQQLKISDLLGVILDVQIPHITRLDGVIAVLTGMRPRTVSGLISRMRRASWRTRARQGRRGRPPADAVAPVASDAAAAPSASRELLLDLAAESDEIAAAAAPAPASGAGSPPRTPLC